MVSNSPALNTSQAAREKQFAHPPVSMGADVCWVSTSQAKDKKAELDAAAGKEMHTTNTP